MAEDNQKGDHALPTREKVLEDLARMQWLRIGGGNSLVSSVLLPQKTASEYRDVLNQMGIEASIGPAPGKNSKEGDYVLILNARQAKEVLGLLSIQKWQKKVADVPKDIQNLLRIIEWEPENEHAVSVNPFLPERAVDLAKALKVYKINASLREIRRDGYKKFFLLVIKAEEAQTLGERIDMHAFDERIKDDDEKFLRSLRIKISDEPDKGPSL